jgi:hypothetical protein
VNAWKNVLARLAALILVAWAIISLASVVVAQSLPETVEAINKSRVTTRILFVTAHPDDEWSSLLAYLSHGLNAELRCLPSRGGKAARMPSGRNKAGSWV